jgi:outer membrane protein assembly factor BamB
MALTMTIDCRSLAFFLWLVLTPVAGADWPDWLGPNRSSTIKEMVIAPFPAQLKVSWRFPVSLGYSGPTVSDGRVYVTDFVPDKAKESPKAQLAGKRQLKGTERIFCVNAKTGEEIWKYVYPVSYSGGLHGPCGTVVLDNDSAYSVSADGQLIVLNKVKGTLIWRKDLKDFLGAAIDEADLPLFGYSVSPLVDEKYVYTFAGGKGSTLVALDKKTGVVTWKAIDSDGIGYSSPVFMEIHGKRQLVAFHASGITALDPATGEEKWFYKTAPDKAESMALPRQVGNRVFVSGPGDGKSALLAIESLGEDKFKVRVVWRGKSKTSIGSALSTPFIVDNGSGGYTVFGADQTGVFVAFDLETGKRFWQKGPNAPLDAVVANTKGDRPTMWGNAYLMRNGSRFVIFMETGELVVAKLSAAPTFMEGFQVISKQKVIDPTFANDRDMVLAHPGFADGAGFFRNDNVLIRVELAESFYMKRGPGPVKELEKSERPD